MIVGDIAQTADRALAWITRQLDRFKPSPSRRLPPQLVALGELGLLVHLLTRSAHPNQPALESCRTALADAYDPRTFEDALRDDRSAVLCAWLTVALGLGDAAQSLMGIIEDPNVFARERLPHRTLELCWLLEALGRSSPYAPSLAEVYRTTYLARPHAIAGASPADCYAVTHTIAYVTDFGARRFFDAAALPSVVADTEAILSLALQWENYDLVAETLAALRWLGASAEAAHERAWRALAERQLPSGAILGVAASGEFLETLRAKEDDPSLFPLFYHPTLVTALAALD